MVGGGVRSEAGRPHICTMPRSLRDQRSDSSFGGACSMNSTGTSALRATHSITARHAAVAAGVTEYIRALARNVTLVGLDLCLAHHFAPALGLGLHARAELLRRLA